MNPYDASAKHYILEEAVVLNRVIFSQMQDNWMQEMCLLLLFIPYLAHIVLVFRTQTHNTENKWTSMAHEWTKNVSILEHYIQSMMFKATSIPPNKQFCLMVKIVCKDQFFFVVAYQNHIYGFGMVQCIIACLFKMIRSHDKIAA